MRVRAYTTWQSSQQSLSKKREQEQKLTAAGKMEKLQVVKAEILEVGVVVGVSCWSLLTFDLHSGREKLKRARSYLKMPPEL